MKKTAYLSNIIRLALLSSLYTSAQAQTINPDETFIMDQFTIDSLDNHGLLITINKGPHVSGVFNNYGNLFASNGFSIDFGIGNGSNYKIINHPEGVMVLNSTTDMDSPDSYFENSGKVSFLNARGGNASGPALYFQGTLINTGSFTIDRNNISNACGLHQTDGNIYNAGFFEIAQGTTCDFSGGFNPNINFVQSSGELKVNGLFAATSIRVNKGTISGSGIIEGFDWYGFFEKVILSPGEPIGTLSISPENNGYIFCHTCSTDIELAGISKKDHLHIFNSDLYLLNWKLNIVLRDGFIPQQGDSFDIVSADNIYTNGTPSYNLPELPLGLSWDITYTGTNVILTVN